MTPLRNITTGTKSTSLALYSLPEQIAEQIAAAIVNDAFKPGNRLKESELSANFGVSRATVREALRLLQMRGLVQIEARRGARVTQLSEEEVGDLYEIRASLLALAARRAAVHRKNFPIGIAEELVRHLEQYASQSTQGKYFTVAHTLSTLIAEKAGNVRLSELIRSFSQQVARYTRLSLQSIERRSTSVQNWKRLIAAIKAGEAAKAEAIMQDLVFGSRDAVRDILQAQSKRKTKSRKFQLVTCDKTTVSASNKTRRSEQ